MTVMSMHNFFLMFDQIMFTGKRKSGKSMYVRRKTIQKRILENLCITVLRVNKELKKGRFVTAKERPAATRAVSVWVGSGTAGRWADRARSDPFRLALTRCPFGVSRVSSQPQSDFSVFFLRHSRRLVATGFQVGANSDAPTRNWQNVKDLHTYWTTAKNARHPTASTYFFCRTATAGNGWFSILYV